MNKVVIGIIVGVVLMNILPIHSTIPVSMYCKDDSLFGCDWNAGMIIKDKLYITIPK